MASLRQLLLLVVHHLLANVVKSVAFRTTAHSNLMGMTLTITPTMDSIYMHTALTNLHQCKQMSV